MNDFPERAFKADIFFGRSILEFLSSHRSWAICRFIQNSGVVPRAEEIFKAKMGVKPVLLLTGLLMVFTSRPR